MRGKVVLQLPSLVQAPDEAHPDGLVIVARSVGPHGVQLADAVDAPIAVDEEVVADVEKAPLPPLPAEDFSGL